MYFVEVEVNKIIIKSSESERGVVVVEAGKMEAKEPVPSLSFVLHVYHTVGTSMIV